MTNNKGKCKQTVEYGALGYKVQNKQDQELTCSFFKKKESYEERLP